MRILVVGDVEGRLQALFARVRSVLKKSGTFEMLLCVGAFFADTGECREQWEALAEGQEEVPIATFVLGPTSPKHTQFYKGLDQDGGELCPNITCLGQRGMYTTSSGLTIAYMSGAKPDTGSSSSSSSQTPSQATSTDSKNLDPVIREADVESLVSFSKREGYKGVDILLTSEWPHGVQNFSTPPTGLDVSSTGTELVSRLALSLKPRYHFSALYHVFHERTPYRNHEVLKGKQLHVTRFIALAQVGSQDKKNRYLYAFSVSPMASLSHQELVQQPPVVTSCPYAALPKNTDLESTSQSRGQNFFFDEKALEEGRKKRQREEEMLKKQMQGLDQPSAKRPLLSHDRGTPPVARGKPPVARGPCWFCLGSPQVEKHLIVSIGDHSYTALPKGGLVEEHVLILPIGHFGATTDAPQAVVAEMSRFKQSLQHYFKSSGRSCVVFERNFKSPHLQLQVIPVPEMPSDDLRQAFVEHGKSLGVEFSEVPPDTPVSELAQVGAPYFVAHFDDGPLLFTRTRGRFPLQFGREVLASEAVLNLPGRVDWKACSVPTTEETQLTLSMRKKFQPFDFTDDD